MVKHEEAIDIVDKFTKDLHDFVDDINKKYGYSITLALKNKDIGPKVLSLPDLHRIIIEVAVEQHPYVLKDMSFKTRKEPAITYQHYFTHIAFYKLRYSKTDIGLYLNKKTHHTILHSIRRCEQYLQVDKKFIGIYNLILRKIENYVGTIPEDGSLKSESKSMSSTL
jgi:hypothetical protein